MSGALFLQSAKAPSAARTAGPVGVKPIATKIATAHNLCSLRNARVTTHLYNMTGGPVMVPSEPSQHCLNGS
jgi:hypothetical protein